MTDQNPWNELFADSMRTFADIEALGRRLAGSIAAEFAADGRPTADQPGADAQRNVPPGDRRIGSMQDMTRDLLTWVDAFSDMARDTIFALADMANSAVAAGGELSAHVQPAETAEVPFWLHSSSGAASRIAPSIDSLTAADGSTIAAHIEPAVADVDPDHPAEFAILVDSGQAAPGTYRGLITAAGVPDALVVSIEVTT